MSSDFIRIDPTQSAATHARLLLEFKDALRRAYELGVRVRGVMRHNFDDSNPAAIVWTSLESLFGIPAGKGSAVFTLVDGAVGAMEGQFQVDAAKVLTEKLG